MIYTQFIVSYDDRRGDCYYAKGDKDYEVIRKTFEKRDAITARNKHIKSITRVIGDVDKEFGRTTWEVVR